MNNEFDLQAYIGDAPEPVPDMTVTTGLGVDDFVTAMETRLKYSPDSNVQFIITAEYARVILGALKEYQRQKKYEDDRIC